MVGGRNIPRADLDRWVNRVGSALGQLPEGASLQAEWEAIPDRDPQMDDPLTRDGFIGLWGMNKRLSWLQRKISQLGTAQAQKRRREEEKDQAAEMARAMEKGRQREASKPPSKLPAKPTADKRVVFVVHGRSAGLRNSMFAFLRAIGLHPLEWSEAIRATGKPTPYIGEILDAAFSQAQAVVVLLTPDDEARLRSGLVSEADPEHERVLTPQARPNVLFEAGMAIGRFPDRTVLVEVGKLRPFSDIGGRHVVRMDGSSQRRQELAHRLRDAGCAVVLDGTDWHTAGGFDPSQSPGVNEDDSRKTGGTDGTAAGTETK